MANAKVNPCAAAVINYENGPDKSRYSWDPLTTLVAVRGAAAGSTRECTDCNGYNVIDPFVFSSIHHFFGEGLSSIVLKVATAEMG